MRRILTLSFISLVAVLAAACGGSTPPSDTTTAKAEATCAQPASPPKAGETPTCTGGCEWNGTECRAQRGIIIHDSQGNPPPKDDKENNKDGDKKEKENNKDGDKKEKDNNKDGNKH